MHMSAIRGVANSLKMDWFDNRFHYLYLTKYTVCARIGNPSYRFIGKSVEIEAKIVTGVGDGAAVVEGVRGHGNFACIGNLTVQQSHSEKGVTQRSARRRNHAG